MPVWRRLRKGSPPTPALQSPPRALRPILGETVELFCAKDLPSRLRILVRRRYELALPSKTLFYRQR